MTVLPGPLLKSFNSYEDALTAACQTILKKPNATAGREDHQDFRTRWRVSTEYCAWIYYTPDEKYEVSRLTDQSEVDPADRSRNCLLPSQVEDRRYPPGSIKYVCALHNHLFDDALSDKDIRYIVSQGLSHGFTVTTAEGVRALSVIAFFSDDVAEPRCAGFHQYVPASGKLFKFKNQGGKWSCEQTGTVTWHDGANLSIEKTKLPCSGKGVP